MLFISVRDGVTDSLVIESNVAHRRRIVISLLASFFFSCTAHVVAVAVGVI